jgi:20S proteasome subunit beta 5
MSLKEAVDLGIRAISSATFKDSASGGVVRVYHVTNQGRWDLIHDAIDVSELHYQFEKSKGHDGTGTENLPKKYW